MSLARNTLVQSTLTLGSRILGFARDLVILARLGQGPMSDAFLTALIFPNVFRRLFAEGAFAQAFVPLYAKSQAESGAAEAARIASESMSFLLAVAAGFCILAQLAMPWIMLGLASEYIDSPDVFSLAIVLTQITMPYLLCMTLASLLSGILNTGGRFALTAAVPTLLNVFTLVAMLPVHDPRQAALAGACAVTAAGFAQAALLWWAVHKLNKDAGVKLRFMVPRLTPDVKRILMLSIPGVIAGGAIQINTLISQFFVGSDEGARTALYNADRLYQLPLGLVGVAIGLALVPRLARSFALNDSAATQQSLDDGIALSMALTLPAAAAMLVMPGFIMDAALVRGAFTSENAARCAEILRQFAWGVPAFVLAKVLTPPFFARQDTRTPMNFALLTIGLNTVLGASLFFFFQSRQIDGVVGLAIATSTAAWVNIFLLALRLKRNEIYRMGRESWGRLTRVLLAVAIMSAVIGVASWQRDLVIGSLLNKELAMLVVAIVGAAVYAGCALLVGAVKISELKGLLKREPDTGQTNDTTTPLDAL
jgi:putative peptidoglycan lipid II flippase